MQSTVSSCDMLFTSLHSPPPLPPRPIPSWPVVLRALTPSYAWLDDDNNTERGRERERQRELTRTCNTDP